GPGNFIQSAGTNIVAGSLTISSSGGAGTYTLNGGTLNATTMTINSNGKLNLNAGTNLFASNIIQQGGLMTVAARQALRVGNAAAGSYTINGGTISTPTIYVGYDSTGTFLQAAGTTVTATAI